MAAAAIFQDGGRRHLGLFRMAISPQRLTIYLYSAHRAVIFAIAQLSCCHCDPVGIFVTPSSPQKTETLMLSGGKEFQVNPFPHNTGS